VNSQARPDDREDAEINWFFSTSERLGLAFTQRLSYEVALRFVVA
jgi:hypothetical protein